MRIVRTSLHTFLGATWHALPTDRLCCHVAGTIYQEDVPNGAALSRVESKIVVKSIPPESPSTADPFGPLLPESVHAALETHHQQVHSLLHGLASQVSTDAQAVQETLRSKDLPHVLEAVTRQDRALPEHTKSKVVKAKGTATVQQLFELRGECESCEVEAASLIDLLEAMLKTESEKDQTLTDEVPAANLSSMRSSMALTTCRSTVSAAAEKVKTANSVTKKLGTRLDAAMDDLTALTPSIHEIEAQMPHLDGTPLEEEPCVGALRTLLESLDQIKVDSAATLGSARQMADEQRNETERLGVALLGGGASSDVLTEAMGVFEGVQASLRALHARRETLLDEVGVQHDLLMRAQGAASNYTVRQEYALPSIPPLASHHLSSLGATWHALLTPCLPWCHVAGTSVPSYMAPRSSSSFTPGSPKVSLSTRPSSHRYVVPPSRPLPSPTSERSSAIRCSPPRALGEADQERRRRRPRCSPPPRSNALPPPRIRAQAVRSLRPAHGTGSAAMRRRMLPRAIPGGRRGRSSKRTPSRMPSRKAATAATSSSSSRRSRGRCRRVGQTTHRITRSPMRSRISRCGRRPSRSRCRSSSPRPRRRRKRLRATAAGSILACRRTRRSSRAPIARCTIACQASELRRRRLWPLL